MNEWLQAITTVGFPIVMCGAMAWYVKYREDKSRAEISALNNAHQEIVLKINEQHKQEISDMTTAINNNTLALTKLCEKLEKEE